MIDSDSPAGAGAGGDVPPLAGRWVMARVSGPSMSPTLRHGDRVLARRLDPGRAAAPGDVVLARFPDGPDALVVKRLRRMLPDGRCWVEGDNQFVERDSRAFGPAVALGRVLFRLWPRPGRLPPPPL